MGKISLWSIISAFAVFVHTQVIQGQPMQLRTTSGRTTYQSSEGSRASYSLLSHIDFTVLVVLICVVCRGISGVIHG